MTVETMGNLPGPTCFSWLDIIELTYKHMYYALLWKRNKTCTQQYREHRRRKGGRGGEREKEERKKKVRHIHSSALNSVWPLVNTCGKNEREKIRLTPLLVNTITTGVEGIR